MNHIKPLMSTVLVLAGLLVEVGGTNAQSANTGNTVIQGCYHKNNGQLRLVASPDECRVSEIPVSWNSQGPQGAPFIRGNGMMSAGSAEVPRFSLTRLLSIPGQVEVFAACSTVQSDLVINVLDGSWAAFFETGQVRMFSRELTTNVSIGNTDAVDGEKFFLQLTKNDDGPTLTVAGSAVFADPCFVQWTATLISK